MATRDDAEQELWARLHAAEQRAEQAERDRDGWKTLYEQAQADMRKEWAEVAKERDEARAKVERSEKALQRISTFRYQAMGIDTADAVVEWLKELARVAPLECPLCLGTGDMGVHEPRRCDRCDGVGRLAQPTTVAADREEGRREGPRVVERDGSFESEEILCPWCSQPLVLWPERFKGHNKNVVRTRHLATNSSDCRALASQPKPEPERAICPGCGFEVDYDTCGCGDAIEGHGTPDVVGHGPVPMGCRCLAGEKSTVKPEPAVTCEGCKRGLERVGMDGVPGWFHRHSVTDPFRTPAPRSPRAGRSRGREISSSPTSKFYSYLSDHHHELRGRL